MTDHTHSTSHLTGGDAPDADLADALGRLRAIESRRGAGSGEPPRPAPRPLRAAHASRGMPHHARFGANERTVARIAAPAAFLVAVIIVLSLAVQSGVIGGGTPSPSPSPSPAKSAAAKRTPRVYVVKSGDTLSGIAARFGTTPKAILALNPGVSSTSLAVGQKLRLPRR